MKDLCRYISTSRMDDIIQNITKRWILAMYKNYLQWQKMLTNFRWKYLQKNKSFPRGKWKLKFECIQKLHSSDFENEREKNCEEGACNVTCWTGGNRRCCWNLEKFQVLQNPIRDDRNLFENSKCINIIDGGLFHGCVTIVRLFLRSFTSEMGSSLFFYRALLEEKQVLPQE